MDSTYKEYDHVDSAARMRAILEQPDVEYTEVDRLPVRDRLTFANGFYALCTALFIDIRGSSKLPDKYASPTLARIYRAYLSEAVAVLNGEILCREVNIVGDGAWAVFNTPYRDNIDDVFSVAAQLSSMIDILNFELSRKDIGPLEVGIGLDYGRALMVKAGFAGSGINDVVYMGDVVNGAAKLAAHGNETYMDRTVQVSNVVQDNLNEHNRRLLRRSHRGCWQSDVSSVDMDAWLRKQRG